MSRAPCGKGAPYTVCGRRRDDLAVHVSVDNCGRRASSCGRQRARRWTTCGDRTAAHRTCDFPTARPPLRPHAFMGSDLRRHPFSTCSTTPMTTTKVLSEGDSTRLHQAPAGRPARLLETRCRTDRRGTSGRPDPTTRAASRRTRGRRTGPSPGSSSQFLPSPTSRRVHARPVCADLRPELLASAADGPLPERA